MGRAVQAKLLEVVGEALSRCGLGQSSQGQVEQGFQGARGSELRGSLRYTADGRSSYVVIAWSSYES